MTFLPQSLHEAVLANSVSSHTLPNMKFASFSIMDVPMYKQVLRSMTNTMAFVSPLLGNVRNQCFSGHPTNGFPLAMAIAAVLCGDSRSIQEAIITRGYVSASMYAFEAVVSCLESCCRLSWSFADKHFRGSVDDGQRRPVRHLPALLGH